MGQLLCREPAGSRTTHAREAQRGRTSHGGNAEDEEETRSAHRSAQHLAAHHHDPAGAGVRLHVHAAAGEDQPGPRHPRRPVGGADGEEHRRPGRVERRHGEEPRHHREPRERAGRLGGRGAGAGHRPDPRADPRPHQHRGRAQHHRQDRQARIRAPRLVHRRGREDEDRERPGLRRGHRLRRSRRGHAADGRDAAPQGGGRHVHAHRHRLEHHEGRHRQAERHLHRLRREHLARFGRRGGVRRGLEGPRAHEGQDRHHPGQRGAIGARNAVRDPRRQHPNHRQLLARRGQGAADRAGKRLAARELRVRPEPDRRPDARPGRAGFRRAGGPHRAGGGHAVPAVLLPRPRRHHRRRHDRVRGAVPGHPGHAVVVRPVQPVARRHRRHRADYRHGGRLVHPHDGALPRGDPHGTQRARRVRDGREARHRHVGGRRPRDARVGAVAVLPGQRLGQGLRPDAGAGHRVRHRHDAAVQGAAHPRAGAEGHRAAPGLLGHQGQPGRVQGLRGARRGRGHERGRGRGRRDHQPDRVRGGRRAPRGRCRRGGREGGAQAARQVHQARHQLPRLPPRVPRRGRRARVRVAGHRGREGPELRHRVRGRHVGVVPRHGRRDHRADAHRVRPGRRARCRRADDERRRR